MTCAETSYAALKAMLLTSHVVSSRQEQKVAVPATLLSKISKVMDNVEYNSRVYLMQSSKTFAFSIILVQTDGSPNFEMDSFSTAPRNAHTA